MRFLSRVVWSEGMYLGPHHFQVQSRYFEDSIQFATSALWFKSYGLAACEMDADALQNGTVSVLHARGIFPDGLPFNMPECDVVPPARAVAEVFPPTRESLTVFLAIPPRRPNGLNCALAEPRIEARYLAESRAYFDENTGADERPVRLGRKNLRLVLDTELTDDVMTLPLARVVRTGTGHFAYDEHFVPPCLHISASARLMKLTTRLLDILAEKSATLTRAPGSAGTEYSSRDIAKFWLLHAVNSGLAPLRHLLVAKRGHPEELFLELSRLAGALCTFTFDSHPRNLPCYDHDRLTECFEELDRQIRALLETVVPTNCIAIPLRPAENYFYDGQVTDQRCFGRSRWVLAVRAAMGESELITRTPQLVKVCSPLFVRELVRRALPGLVLTHLPVPPPAIAARVETQYFNIDKAGPCWNHMMQTRSVGVYVPGDLPTPEIELLVILDN